MILIQNSLNFLTWFDSWTAFFELTNRFFLLDSRAQWLLFFFLVNILRCRVLFWYFFFEIKVFFRGTWNDVDYFFSKKLSVRSMRNFLFDKYILRWIDSLWWCLWLLFIHWEFWFKNFIFIDISILIFSLNNLLFFIVWVGKSR